MQWKSCIDWNNYYETYPCTFANPVGAGHAIIVYAGTTAGTLLSPTDDASNTYDTDLTWLRDTQPSGIFSTVSKGATQTVTFKSSGSTGHFQVVILEVAGLKTSRPLKDQAPAAKENGFNGSCAAGSFSSNTTGITAQANEFALGYAMQLYSNAMTITEDTPWTHVVQMTGLTQNDGADIAYRTTGSIGSYYFSGTFTGSGGCDVFSAIVTYAMAMPNPPTNVTAAVQ